MATHDHDEKRESKMADEIYVEKVEQPSTLGTSGEDAAMTRRILLKLDFRYDAQEAVISVSDDDTNRLTEFSRCWRYCFFARSWIAQMLGMQSLMAWKRHLR
jgi:hypothetical protein